MIKNFNSVPMLKSSEVCNKFSKSVSYETLVGGTTTTGRGSKQIRRLFLSSADKPLSAVGTLTSLLCNSAKVMEKLLNRHSEPKAKNPEKTGTVMPDLLGHLSRIKKESAEFLGSRLLSCPRMTMMLLIRFANASLRMTMKRRLRMTIPVLALIFTFATTSESRADVIKCVNGEYDDGTTCEKCGDNCDWSFDTVSGKLSVTGSGEMYNYSFSIDNETNAQYTTAPWKIYKDEIKSVKVEGLSTIGKFAFCNSGAQLTAVEMSDTVTDINEGAFAWNHAISTIKLSDSLKSIGDIAFRGSSGGFSPSIIVPDTLEEVGYGSLGTGKNAIQNMQIICLGNELSCARVKNLFNEYKHYGSDYSRETLSLAGNVFVANYEQCSGSYFWNGAGCVREPDLSKRKCCDSCKDMGGWCNRIRYTPAEAAKVLHDDNTNEVTITFKK